MRRNWFLLAVLALTASALSFGQGDFSKKPPPDGPPPLPDPSPGGPPSDLDIFCADWAAACGAVEESYCRDWNGPVGATHVTAVVNHGIPPEDNAIGTDVVVTNANVGVWVEYEAYGITPDHNILMANYCVSGMPLSCRTSQCEPDTDGDGQPDCFLACDGGGNCKSVTCPGYTPNHPLEGCTRKSACSTCTCELSRGPKVVGPGSQERTRCSMPDCGSELPPCDNPDPQNPDFCSAPSPAGAANVRITAVNFDGGACFLPLDVPLDVPVAEVIRDECGGAPVVLRNDSFTASTTD